MADLATWGPPLRGVLRPLGAATATVSIVFDGSGEVCGAVLTVVWHPPACTQTNRGY